MEDKIWLKSYPSGVPAEVPEPPFRSIRDLVENSFREYPDQPAFANMQPIAVALAAFDGVTEGVAKIENGPAPRLSFVFSDNLRLEFAGTGNGMISSVSC